MAGISTVPKALIGFNDYIDRTDDYLQAGGEVTNATRLLFQEDEISMWHNTRVSWDAVYILYKDAINQRTRAMSANLHDIKDEFVSSAKNAHLIQRLAASPNVTSQDLEVFNIKNISSKSHTNKSPISITVIPEIKVLDGGRMAITCRHALVDKTSASIPSGANMLEYKYQVGGTPPAGADDSTLRLGLSTKAKFHINLGTSHRTEYLYIYFRWSNSRHQANCGPWSSCQAIVIT